MNPERFEKNEQIGQSDGQTEWDQLQDVPFKGENNSDAMETISEQKTSFETAEDIRGTLEKYKIEGGRVLYRDTGEEVEDKDELIDARVAAMIFSFAKLEHQDNRVRDGKGGYIEDVDFYIGRAMRKFGVGEANKDSEFGFAKMYDKLVDEKGLSENSSAHGEIGNSRGAHGNFGVFEGPNRDFGVAMLEYKLREKGEELTNFEMNIDRSTEGQGYMRFDINVETAPRESEQSEDDKKAEDNGIHHSAAKQLAVLEEGLKRARGTGDVDAVAWYEAARRDVVSKNRMEVSLEDFNAMSDDDKSRFFEIKKQEAHVLGDEEEFNFWNNNLKSLKGNAE